MSGAQTSSFYPVNQLLVDNAQQIANQYAPQRNELLMQRAQQEIGGTEIEMLARGSQSLLALGDEAKMAAAYPATVAELQRYGFAKNAPSVFPGKARLEQIAAMGTPSKEQYDRQSNIAANAATWPVRDGAAPGAGPAAGGGGGFTGGAPQFTGDREKDRQIIVARESGGDPAALNYVARQDPTAYARGATASGKYQFVNSTWREGLQLAGLDPAQYPEARQAPEAVQDKVFDAVYGKYGTAPWDPSKWGRNWAKNASGSYDLTATPGGSGGGVVARNPGAVNVAGPGAPTAPSVPAPVTIEPETGVPVVASPAAPPAAPVQPGVTPPSQATPPAQQPPAATVATPATPAIQPPEPRTQTGYTAKQNAVLDGMVRANRPNSELRAQMNVFDDNNRAADTQYQAQVERVEAARRHAENQQIARDNAVRDAKRLELQIAAAKRAGLPDGYKLDDSGKAVRIDGLPPDPAVQAAQDKIAERAAAQGKQAFEQADKLRDEFQKLTGDFRIVQTSYENIRSAAKANDGAGDMSMLYNYVRLLDPTSVVRESEFASAAASGSFGERVAGAVQRVLNGGRMPESLRQSFIREGQNLYNNQLKSHDAIANQYETLAKRFGLEPDRVVTRFNRPQDADELKAGDIKKGYRFKGGDPADPTSWDKVE